MTEIEWNTIVHDSQYVDYQKRLIQIWIDITSEFKLNDWLTRIYYKYSVENLQSK